MIRLNKFLAECGVESRRKCDALILEGRVTVNDKTVTTLGLKIDEKADNVKINGKLLSQPAEFEYIILNKPKGYVSTVADDQSRKTVLTLVNTKNRLFPVGRLDMDTTGLLLLTNDGELSYKLTHPKYEIDKTYAVTLNSILKSSDKQKLESGIYLEEGKTSECKIEYPNMKNKRLLHITIHQGWKRQIRRMFAKLDYNVLELKRIIVASLNLNGLRIGEWRKMSLKEVHELKNSIGLDDGNRN